MHTGAARSVAEHPITELWRAGLSLSYHTDNTLISRVTQSDEAAALLAHTPLRADDLVRMALLAAEHSFLPAAARAAATAEIRARATALGVAAAQDIARITSGSRS